MGFSYTISLMLYFSDVHKKFGYHDNEEFRTNMPELPEKYHSCINGIYGSLDFEFLKPIIDNFYDQSIIYISSEMLDLIPDIDTFLSENIDKIDNIDDFKQHYQTLKEFIEYLCESDMTWYLSFSY